LAFDKSAGPAYTEALLLCKKATMGARRRIYTDREEKFGFVRAFDV